MEDCLLLQGDLNNLKEWCFQNFLPLNTDKCQVVSFTLSHNFPQFDYDIDNHVLKRCTSVKDLGVLYDSKFTFKEHVVNSVDKAGKMYGLEYCPLAWFPYYNYQILMLETVQRKFLKYLYFKDEGAWPARNYPQEVLLEKYNFNSLQCRR
ncbi:uncharacterized protein LOC135146642, partial [Zophobas morio]|uniref:uncharacterized protein LOC135146642 n=1 Tax=Zophobas morio TaxID=2755281 RepID=UPI0030827E38